MYNRSIIETAVFVEIRTNNSFYLLLLFFFIYYYITVYPIIFLLFNLSHKLHVY